MREDTGLLISYLEQQKIDAGLISDVKVFRETYETEAEVQDRLAVPDMLFYGKDILEMSIAALLQGENLLLSGAKATGKNVLYQAIGFIVLMEYLSRKGEKQNGSICRLPGCKKYENNYGDYMPEML